jgi:hypothetical protein
MFEEIHTGASSFDFRLDEVLEFLKPDSGILVERNIAYRYDK